MPNFSMAQSALSAVDVVMNVSASNIANINTDGYKASRVTLQSGPADEGVRVAAVHRDMTPGPAVISHLSENDVRGSLDVAARNMRVSEENYDAAAAQDRERLQQANAPDSQKIHEYREGQRARSLTEGSNTDLPRELATHVVMESAYSANAATIRAMDEMTGSILNIKA